VSQHHHAALRKQVVLTLFYADNFRPLAVLRMRRKVQLDADIQAQAQSYGSMLVPAIPHKV
jgi:hypothetical protein